MRKSDALKGFFPFIAVMCIKATWKNYFKHIYDELNMFKNVFKIRTK